MRRVVVFLLSFLAATSAFGQDAAIPQKLPTGFQLDGLVSEWRSAAPFAQLGPTSQVAGKLRSGGAADFSGTAWLVFAPEGIVLAADITDDVQAMPASAAEVVQKDHAELWVSFPAAEMPDLGYSQFYQGEIEVPDATWCDANDGIGSPATCKAWVGRQAKRRSTLPRLFTRQFLISTAGVEEAYFAQVAAGLRTTKLPSAWLQGSAGSRAKVVPRQGG